MNTKTTLVMTTAAVLPLVLAGAGWYWANTTAVTAWPSADSGQETTATILSATLPVQKSQAAPARVAAASTFPRALEPAEPRRGQPASAAKQTVQSVKSQPASPARPDKPPVSTIAADLTQPDEERRALAARRITLEDASLLQQTATDPSPLVRVSALEGYRQLEAEYEATTNTLRRPGEPGQFLPPILETLTVESDPFVIESALGYIGEYGENTSEAEGAVRQLLQRSDLSATVLTQAGELLMDNYNLSPDLVREAIYSSPSAQQLPEAELNYLRDTLEALDSGNSASDTKPGSGSPEATVSGRNNAAE